MHTRSKRIEKTAKRNRKWLKSIECSWIWVKYESLELPLTGRARQIVSKWWNTVRITLWSIESKFVCSVWTHTGGYSIISENKRKPIEPIDAMLTGAHWTPGLKIAGISAWMGSSKVWFGKRVRAKNLFTQFFYLGLSRNLVQIEFWTHFGKNTRYS